MPAQSIVHTFTVMANSDKLTAPCPAKQQDSPPADANGTILNGREARNLAEKQRRDKLNACINELSKMVPHVADSVRRLDKTAILRFATHGMRLQYIFGKSAAKRESFLKSDDSESLTDALMALIDSFFITLTCHGQIVLISTSVEDLLGHTKADLYGQNLLQFTHPDDQQLLRQQLIPSDIQSLFQDMHHSSPAAQSQMNNSQAHYSQHQSSCKAPSTPATNGDYEQNEEDYLREIDHKLRSDKRSFIIRVARSSNRGVETKKKYEFIRIDGCFRRSDNSAVATGANSYPLVSQLIRRSRTTTTTNNNGDNTASPTVGSAANMPHLTQHDAIAQAALHGVSGNDVVLVGMARIVRFASVLNCPAEANRLEYKTRHLIDGRIIDCDHRIGLVAGYLQEEVRNLCPFSFMHQDDVRWVIVALRQMYDCNSDYGESCYRLLSRNGNFIYLETKGYLEIHMETRKVHSFICVNTLLTEDEGRRKVQGMKDKFALIINTKVPASTMQDVTASQNPQQLEKIVLYLIENLHKREANTCVVDEIHTEEDAKRHTNTPPLALVPPEPASVKHSISVSVSVVISTAAKSLVYKNNLKASLEKLDKKSVPLTNGVETRVNPESSPIQPSRPSVLQMKHHGGQENFNSMTQTRINPQNAQRQQETPQQVSVLKRLRPDRNTESTTAYSSQIEHDDDYQSPQPSKRSATALSPSSMSSATDSSSASASSPAIKNDSSSDIHNFISNSLRHVGESLTRITADTASLLQCSNLPPALDNKLDAIMMERQKQNEFLVNIKNEYDVYNEQYATLPPLPPNRTEQQQLQQQSSLTANAL